MPKFSNIDWSMRLFQLSIILIPFSYQPRIHISSLQGFNLEFSLVQVASSLFILSCTKLIWRHRAKLLASWPIRLFTAFVAFNWISIVWSANISRSLVLALFWVFLLGLVIATTAFMFERKPKSKDITNPLLIGAIIGSAWAIWQVLGEALGVSQAFTLLRDDYTSAVFGFARAQSFALEPQFYASTLLAPMLYLMWRIFQATQQRYHLVLLVWFIVTFMLTVSRGGLLGLILGFLVLLSFVIFDKKVKELRSKLLILSSVGIASIGISIISVFFVANILETGAGRISVEKFIDHMSAGYIDISINEGGNIEGLVEQSTTGRLYMTERAFDILNQSKTNYIYGVGVGSFGPVFRETFDDKYWNFHVINNQYVEFLTELGVIGLGLFLAFIGLTVKKLKQTKNKYSGLLIAILSGYLIQYVFFSLQTNVIHIWMLIGVMIGLVVTYENRQRSKA